MNELRTTENELRTLVTAAVDAVLQQLPLLGNLDETTQDNVTIKLSEHLVGFRKSLRIQEGLSAKTVQSYSAKVIEFFNWLEKNQSKTSPGSVILPDLEAYLEHLFYKKNGPATRNLKILSLRRFFKYLKLQGVIQIDITKDILKAKIRRGMVKKFTRKEILKIFKAIDPATEMGMRDIVIFILGAFCGLRLSEIRGLNLTDLSFDDNGCCDIAVGNANFSPKADSFRTVDLWKLPSEYLRQWLVIRQSHNVHNEAFLISYTRGDHPRPEKRLPALAVYNLVKAYARSAKIKKKATVHMLRGTHASDLRFIKGYDVYASAERLGHAYTSSMDPYVSVRSRVGKQYNSLAAYWREFKSVWDVEQPEASTGV